MPGGDDHLLENIAGYPQLLGGDKDEIHILVAHQRLDKGVNRAAKFQVAAQPDGHAADFSPLAADGEHVCQGLGGMLVAAVSGVDDGDVGVAGGHIRSALLEVAHGGDVRVAGDHADGIRHAFALGGGRAVC